MNDGTNLAVEVSQPLAEARVFKIVTQEHYVNAGERLKVIMGLKRKVDAAFDPIIADAHKAHKTAVAKKKEHEAPLIEAERILKTGMIGYQQEQEHKAREEQAKLDEIARKGREKLEAQAAKAAAKGKTEKAAELQERAATVPTPVVTIATPTVAGISTRETHKAVVSNKTVLIEAVAGGRRVVGNPGYAGPERRVHPKVPDAVLSYDQAVLNAQARALKSALNYPGVRVETVHGISSRSV